MVKMSVVRSYDLDRLKFLMGATKVIDLVLPEGDLCLYYDEIRGVIKTKVDLHSPELTVDLPRWTLFKYGLPESESFTAEQWRVWKILRQAFLPEVRLRQNILMKSLPKLRRRSNSHGHYAFFDTKNHRSVVRRSTVFAQVEYMLVYVSKGHVLYEAFCRSETEIVVRLVDREKYPEGSIHRVFADELYQRFETSVSN